MTGPRPGLRRRAAGTTCGLLALVVIAAACTSSGTAETASTSSSTAPGTTTAPVGTAPGSSVVDASPTAWVFSTQGNNLDVYDADDPAQRQQVITGRSSVPPPGDPEGWDVNGQVCAFVQDGQRYLVTGEDTGQPELTPGWAVWRLTGDAIGELQAERVAKLVHTYQDSAEGPDNYGCGVLPDGRIVTTDIGNNAAGPANGQLTIWFPPYDGEDVSYCKIDRRLATGQSIAVDGDDVYVTSPRPSDDPEATAGGVWRYRGPFPTSDDAAGGCGGTDEQGSPVADTVTKERVLAAGSDGLVSPSGLALGPDGHWYVSSVITGTINEYDAGWGFVSTVLAPPEGEQIGAETYSTGTPLGLAVTPDGAVWYADIAIVAEAGGRGFGPAERQGSVRRITLVDGVAQPPETVASGLAFPDGLGVSTP